MCGIAGIVDFSGLSTLNTIHNMTDALRHRGPDDSGYFSTEYQETKIFLGHRRLSILDLSRHGHQPMTFRDLTIAYNGEVYNFKEIRSELEVNGYTFDSDSDTEVVLKAYHKWGIDAIHRFNGMFSVAIYDEKRKTLTLVRDRAGVKPLYWYQQNGLFAFASELKSFHQHPCFVREINQDGLSLFLQYGYIPQPYTIFNSTHKLEAGHYLELSVHTGKVAIRKYWDVLDYYKQPKLDVTENEALETIEGLLKSACEYRMVSDVPVGIFLSGGYDSSIVTALLQSQRSDRLKTFSIGFHDERFNEADHARNVAAYLGTDHTEYYCTQSDMMSLIPQLAEIWDEPFGDSSAIPTTLVSQLARKQVSVSLSADGGDEIFGGYDKYTSIRGKIEAFGRIPKYIKPIVRYGLNQKLIHNIAEKLNVYNAESRLKRFAIMLEQNEKEMLKTDFSTFTNDEINELLISHVNSCSTAFESDINENWLDNMLAIDYKTFQADDILTKVDRATMSASLEGREPLIDHRIIEYMSRIDPNLKIRGGEKKYLLKKICHNYIPATLMDRPKKGFSIPIESWLREDLREYLLTYLSRDRIENANIFNTDMVVDLRDRYLSGESVNVKKIWYLLVFELWRERWMQ